MVNRVYLLVIIHSSDLLDIRTQKAWSIKTKIIKTPSNVKDSKQQNNTEWVETYEMVDIFVNYLSRPSNFSYYNRTAGNEMLNLKMD